MSTTNPSLFEYAAIWHPNESQAKEGQKSKIVISPTVVLAKDKSQAEIGGIK